jgi:hypothetical protein
MNFLYIKAESKQLLSGVHVAQMLLSRWISHQRFRRGFSIDALSFALQVLLL